MERQQKNHTSVRQKCATCTCTHVHTNAFNLQLPKKVPPMLRMEKNMANHEQYCITVTGNK